MHRTLSKLIIFLRLQTDPRYEDEVSGCTACVSLITGDKIYIVGRPLLFLHSCHSLPDKAGIMAHVLQSQLYNTAGDLCLLMYATTGECGRFEKCSRH